MAKRDAWDDISYYELLQVEPNASTDDIKKAYKRMALKWHPDKNPDSVEEADKVFKLVAQAYEVLSDPQKRDVYDRYGKEGLQDGGVGGGHGFHFTSANDIFEQFFGTNDPFADFGSMFGGGGGQSNRGGGGFFGGFGGFGGFGVDFGDGFGDGGSSFATFSSGSGSGGLTSMSSSQTYSRGGKTITKKTSTQNGVKTVEEFENGQLVSKTVNGQAMAVEGGEIPAISIGSKKSSKRTK
ncbi:dnaJ homolog subfamily B member 6-B-like [Halichondria panicea]|uniref:dnaJ homolog subfamily B member 6-B-like n=1 Tax=Halichondria panicea TaxID=6063 RepID=UPI00312B56FB